jgi:phospholipid/cholesterol/gamma-HCH transport system substrate-binding protein
MERSALNLWVGLFVAAGFAALLVLAFKVGNLGTASISDSYTVTAHFDNIGGLKERAPVRSAGVVVGRVIGIRFDDKRYDAEVTMRLDRRYKFPKDTTASILTSGILGENYVGLDAGGDTESLSDGGNFKLTQSAVVLEKLIGQFLFSKAQDATPQGGGGGSAPAAKPQGGAEAPAEKK